MSKLCGFYILVYINSTRRNKVNKRQIPRNNKMNAFEFLMHRNNRVNTTSSSVEILDSSTYSIEESQSETVGHKTSAIKSKRSTKYERSKSNTSKTSTLATKKARKRKRRISSSESMESQHSNETLSEDLSKNVSIKKQDSGGLLGYFSKTIIPIRDIDEKNGDCSSRKRCRKRSTELTERDKLDEKNNSIIEKRESPNLVAKRRRGRPRKICPEKAQLEYEALKSSDNDNTGGIYKKTRSTNSTVKPAMIEGSENSPPIEIIDNSPEKQKINKCNTLKSVQPSEKKLAPLFNKKPVKVIPNVRESKARHEFLMSGLPEKMKIDIERQLICEQMVQTYSEIFPTISHVGHVNSLENPLYKFGKINYCKSYDEDIKITRPKKKDSLKFSTDRMERINIQNYRHFPLMMRSEDKRWLIKHFKTLFDKFPTYRCYNQLREKYSLTRAGNFEEQQEDDDSTPLSRYKDQTLNNTLNENLMFTDKYKPSTREEILINTAPVSDLKDFLAGWQKDKLTRTQDSSDEDFNAYVDSSSNFNNLRNFVVLHGPCSSGKTSAVSALANEMNFNVLEINAGMKRTGRKVLQKLQEATQSHRLKSKNSISKNSNNLGKNYINDNSEMLDNSNKTKLSLILIEDADIVFEQDNGFVEAIYQLVSTSRRPVVLVCNNLTGQHLLKLGNENSISFPVHNDSSVSKFLSVLSLVESCPIRSDDILSLYLYNQRNFRKTLIEIQFFIKSGGDRCSTEIIQNKDCGSNGFKDQDNENFRNIYMHKKLFEFFSKNQNFNQSIGFPIDFNILWFNFEELLKNSNQLLQNTVNETTVLKKKQKTGISPKRALKIRVSDNICENLSELYEDISSAIHFSSQSDRDRINAYLHEDIAYKLTGESIRINFKTDLNNYVYTNNSNKSTPPPLSANMVQNNLRSLRSLGLDYDACLRSICRSERFRSDTERRRSRFYHYLKNICAPLNSFSVNEFNVASYIFETDSKNESD